MPCSVFWCADEGHLSDRIGEPPDPRNDRIVEDVEANVRRILDFCELAFEPACLEFYKTARRIHTVSSEQVRRPINKEGVDQWRNFAPWLEPLRTALGPYAKS